MKFIKEHQTRYYGNRVIKGEIHESEGNLIFKMPRKQQQVRKDVVKLQPFEETNGDAVYQRLKENPHPAVMKVYDFTADHLFVEFVDGLMLYHTYEWEAKELYRGYDGIEFYFPGNPYITGMDTDIVEGLNHLHEIGIYHGDFKPNNIMVTKDGKIKIIDFHASIALGPDYVDYDKDMISLKKVIRGLANYKTTE